MQHKIKKRKYLQFLINTYKNFEYLTKDNTGIYVNKVRFLYHGIDYKTYTKEQLLLHIETVKKS